MSSMFTETMLKKVERNGFVQKNKLLILVSALCFLFICLTVYYKNKYEVAFQKAFLCPATNWTPTVYQINSNTQQPTIDSSDIMTRDEFRKAVVGKTQEQVISAVGKPNTTQDDGYSIYWYYGNKSKDPITDIPDTSTQVVFDNGVVSNVNF